jgi:NAD(P)H dehydrogenase (quinone)
MTTTYIVTGVSGYVGNRVAEILVERVDPARLIVTSRNEETLARWRERGADARYADYGDPDSLVRAFAGGDRLFMVSAMLVGPRRRAQHRHAIDAARAAGVQHVVYTSFLGARDPESKALVSEDHIFTEKAIREAGLGWTFMRNSQYADAMAEQIGQIASSSGKNIHNSGDGLMAFVSRDDVAAAGAELLLGAGEPNTAYEVTGPELLTYGNVGELIAELSGADVESISLSDDDFYAMWDAMGVPREADEDPDAAVPWCSDDMVSFGRDIRAGALAVRSTAVEDLTGRPAETLRTVMERSSPAWATRP